MDKRGDNKVTVSNSSHSKKEKCPICNKNHDWFQVYTESNSMLKKMREVHICWCRQQNDYILSTIMT